MASKVITGAEGLFADSNHSELYYQFRPKPPKELLDKILSFMREKLQQPYKQVVDVGCGNGQSTTLLSPHFTNVLGIDVSESQITGAIKRETCPNVQYKIGGCDDIPLPDSSTELVTCSQAAHWFHLPSFYKEVDRVLVPGGVLAMYCYNFPKPFGHPKCEELRGHLRHMYNVDTAGYWHKNRKIVDDHYASVELPYKEHLRDITVIVDEVWTVANYVGYIKTWSGFQALFEKDPEKANQALSNFENKMMKTLDATTSPENTKLSIRWTYFLIMARKPTV